MRRTYPPHQARRMHGARVAVEEWSGIKGRGKERERGCTKEEGLAIARRRKERVYATLTPFLGEGTLSACNKFERLGCCAQRSLRGRCCLGSWLYPLQYTRHTAA